MSVIFIFMNIFDAGVLMRNRRKALGLDQGELSRIAGISVHALSNIESGVGNPTLKTITKVLDALGLEFTVQPKSPPSPSIKHPVPQRPRTGQSGS